jgi:CYTH domain-containing protein
MRNEIERKFLVRNDGWKAAVVATRVLREGLITQFEKGKLRVRIEDRKAWITLKGRRTGLTRLEFDYEIPCADADALLSIFCNGNIIEKKRHLVAHSGLTWEVDVYRGVLRGLVMADIELRDEDEHILLPDWLGREVTYDSRYRKTALMRNFAGGASTS